MPYYVFECRECGNGYEEAMPFEDTLTFMLNKRCVCGGEYRRNFRAENATNSFRPTVDLYANDLARRAVKNEKIQRHE